MEILEANADIAPLVFSLTLKGVLSPQPRNRIRQRWDDPAGTMRLWEKLPNLRVLRLVNLRFNTGLHQLLPVAYSLPRLDELAVVGSIAMLPRECGQDRPSYRESVVALDSDAPPSLKRLSVTEGSISWSFLEGLAMLLREPGMRAPLEALDLSCIARSSNFKYASLDRTDTLPSQAWAPVIGSLAPTLRRCTLGLLAEECWRMLFTFCLLAILTTLTLTLTLTWVGPAKNLENLYGSLARCTCLQSLGIRCSVLVHPLENSGHCPFIFLDMLANVLAPSSLSEGVPSRFPDLETLSIEWVCASTPIPPGCADACEKLARAIEEGRSRVPRLARLNVAVSTSRRTAEIPASQWREVEAQEPILRSCFERVALVGVQLQLDVSVD